MYSKRSSGHWVVHITGAEFGSGVAEGVKFGDDGDRNDNPTVGLNELRGHGEEGEEDMLQTRII